MVTPKATTNGRKPRVTPGKPVTPAAKYFPPLPPAPVDPEDDDFLAFWNEHTAKEAPKTKKILGVVVTVPYDLPIAFEGIEDEMANETDVNSKEAAAIHKRMLMVLFGEGTYEQWKANGITPKQLTVITVWGMKCARGKEITFAEAQVTVDEMDAAEEAKKDKPVPANRAAKRKDARKPASSDTPRSGGTGARSKQISRASTASPKTS